MANDEWMLREYFALNDTVDRFDQRLLTIKGWGVTVGLASLGLGFHTTHYGLFLVAAVSGASFLAIEGLTKRHQVRHYLRMREIEVQRAFAPDWNGSPQIDWRWTVAESYFLGKDHGHELALPQPYQTPYRFYRQVWLGSVALPHVITIILGSILFLLGLLGYVGTAA
jgi:hypothetical protein